MKNKNQKVACKKSKKSHADPLSGNNFTNDSDQMIVSGTESASHDEALSGEKLTNRSEPMIALSDEVQSAANNASLPGDSLTNNAEPMIKLPRTRQALSTQKRKSCVKNKNEKALCKKAKKSDADSEALSGDNFTNGSKQMIVSDTESGSQDGALSGERVINRSDPMIALSDEVPSESNEHALSENNINHSDPMMHMDSICGPSHDGAFSEENIANLSDPRIGIGIEATSESNDGFISVESLAILLDPRSAFGTESSSATKDGTFSGRPYLPFLNNHANHLDPVIMSRAESSTYNVTFPVDTPASSSDPMISLNIEGISVSKDYALSRDNLTDCSAAMIVLGTEAQSTSSNGAGSGYNLTQHSDSTIIVPRVGLAVTTGKVYGRNQKLGMQCAKQMNSIPEAPTSVNLQASPQSSNSKEHDIIVSKVSKKDGRRLFDKRACCKFCDERVLNFARHIKRKHKTEIEVAKILFKTDKKMRRVDFLKLQYQGNFTHNSKVLTEKEGELIVVRRSSTKSETHDKYLPCVHCLGFFATDQLYRHSRKCPCKPDDSPTTSSTSDEEDIKQINKVVAKSRLLLSGALGEGSVLEEDTKVILSRMRADLMKTRIESDQLIMKLGLVLFKKLGKARISDIVQRMRQLAKFTSLMSENRQMSLSDCLDGKNFDRGIAVIEQMCGVKQDERGRKLYDKPSVGLRIGHSLLKCAQLKRGFSIRNNDSVMLEEAETYIKLHGSEYTDSVSHVALTTMKLLKDESRQTLPSTADLVKLRNYLENGIKQGVQKLSDQEANYSTWRNLSELALSRLIIFNKRRGGEASKLLLSAYQHRPNWNEEVNRELESTLSPVEQHLKNRMDLILIPGKRNRQVPILLTEDLQVAMKALYKTRSQCGIPEENVYFFATPSSDGHLSGWLVLNKVANLAQLENPAVVTSTRLRKYIATVSQVRKYGCLTICISTVFSLLYY